MEHSGVSNYTPLRSVADLDDIDDHAQAHVGGVDRGGGGTGREGAGNGGEGEGSEERGGGKWGERGRGEREEGRERGREARREGEGSRDRGGGKRGERGREAGIGYPLSTPTMYVAFVYR